KQVIHSAYTMLANIHQLALYGTADEFRPSWLVTILPPCLIAVVNSMLLMAIASRKILIMDPFVDVNDIDLEIMRYKPNGWPAVPMFVEVLIKSKRIPDDYDISHLFACGTGAETLNKGQWKRAQEFLKKHNSQAFLTAGYGLTEAGSSCFFPCPAAPFGKGAIGMPIPLNVVSIFKPNTQEELSYDEFGEVCIHTPAAMLGYDNEEKTREVLQTHADGLKWIHTGDFGYMDENGVLYVYGRGETYRYGGGYLSEIFMENNIVDAEIPGLVDNFFVITEDPEHEGCFIPYLYVVLEDGYTVEDIRAKVCEALQEFEWPVEIIQIPERPFFHFKTNRIGLAKEIKNNRIHATEQPAAAKPVQPVQKETKAANVPECTLNEFLHRSYLKPSDAAMKYYGTDLSWEKVFCLVEQTVRALRSIGFEKDDRIPVFLRSVPEFIILLLAAEKIGATLLSGDNLAAAEAEIIRTSGKHIAIVHDFITQQEVDAMEDAGVETFICLSPYHFADRKQIPAHIDREIQALYSGEKARFSKNVLDWNAFIEAGDSFFGFDEEIRDIDRPLYCNVPDASDPAAKPVVHTAHSILGILTQILEVKPLTSSSDPFGA
ncbi:MAG: AMP-binding protein, partial [Clostridia bacterium]|nr:AMP-binding protein [Clostridia bacterium]